MFTDQKEALPLVKKGRLLGKDIILVHHTVTKVNQRADNRELNKFGTELARKLGRLKVAPRVVTVATPIGKSQAAINKYCELYDRILVFVTTQHTLQERMRQMRGNICLDRSLDGPVQHITVSELNDRVLEEIYQEVCDIHKKIIQY